MHTLDNEQKGKREKKNINITTTPQVEVLDRPFFKVCYHSHIVAEE
jgi:hypothetical protein